MPKKQCRASPAAYISFWTSRITIQTTRSAGAIFSSLTFKRNVTSQVQVNTRK